MSRFELSHLFVDISAARRLRRGEDNQGCRVLKRCERLTLERAPGVELEAVAEDRLQAFVHRPGLCRPADKVFVDAKCLKTRVHALCHPRIGVAIRKKGPILQCFPPEMAHRLPPPDQWRHTAFQLNCLGSTGMSRNEDRPNAHWSLPVQGRSGP